MKKSKRKIFIEIILVVIVISVLASIMIPRFLGAQRKGQYAGLQKVIFTVTNALAEDITILDKLSNNSSGIGIYSCWIFYSNEMGSGSAQSNTKSLKQNPIINKGDYSSTEYQFRYSELCDLMPDVSLPHVYIDPEFGEPVFHLVLTYYHKGKIAPQLVYFGIYTEIVNAPVLKSKFASEFTGIIPSLIVNDDQYFQPLIRPYHTGWFYHPSNGLGNSGILYRDSYSAGWRVRAAKKERDVLGTGRLDWLDPERYFINGKDLE